MKIAIISGSHRKQSKSRLVADWVADQLIKADLQPELFDLAEMEMPFWSEELWNSASSESAAWQPQSERLRDCEGVVLISPEWAGMIPPKLGNFLLMCSSQELAYKPTLLIGVSAGVSGTYPIAQLRMNGAKNNQMLILPDHLIVRQAGSAEAFERLQPRLVHNIGVLRTLAGLMKTARQTIDLKAYPYGL